MRTENTPSIPAGWYDDNRTPAMRRYWDGSHWTDRTQVPTENAEKVEHRMPGQYLSTTTIVVLVTFAVLGAFALIAVMTSMEAERDAGRQVDRIIERQESRYCYDEYGDYIC